MSPKAVLLKISLTPLNTVSVVRVKGVNAVKSSTYWGKPEKDNTGFVDSGCSRHMTRNIAYLLDFKEFDGGYVTFEGGAHSGRISSKGTLKTDSLDFKDIEPTSIAKALSDSSWVEAMQEEFLQFKL
ncbi:hypothetical protein Tco_0122607 [Tanacetum coccineum]